MRIARGTWPLAIVATLACVVAILAIARFVSFFVWSENIGKDLARLTLDDTRLPVTLTAYGRSTDTVSARLDFYTADGDLSGTLERSWSGWEIKVDCILVKAGSGWIAFPFLAYTDASLPGSGIDLVKYYNRSGFPAIYESVRLSAQERKAIKRLFAIARTELWMPSVFGSLMHRTVALRTFEPGVEYALYVGSDGSLRFRKD